MPRDEGGLSANCSVMVNVKKLYSLKPLVRTMVAVSHHQDSTYQKGDITKQHIVMHAVNMLTKSF